MRLLHVIGLGWSGSSAVFEDLRDRASVAGLTDGGDGETCILCKRSNPQDFQRFHPEHRLTPVDVLHLLTGGRWLGFGERLAWAPDPERLRHRDGVAVSQEVVAHLQRHKKYARANQHVLQHVDEQTFLALIEDAEMIEHPSTRAGTRALLRNIGRRTTGDAQYLILNNDPAFAVLNDDDLASDDVYLFVVRGARSQLADLVNEQLLMKQLEIPTRSMLLRWLRDQLRYRRGLRTLLRRSLAGGIRARIATIRFEDYVTSPSLRSELHRRLDLDDAPSTVDFEHSRANIHVAVRWRVPLLVRLALPLLDLAQPPTMLEGLEFLRGTDQGEAET